MDHLVGGCLLRCNDFGFHNESITGSHLLARHYGKKTRHLILEIAVWNGSSPCFSIEKASTGEAMPTDEVGHEHREVTWRTVWAEVDIYASTVFLLVKVAKYSLSTKGDGNLFNMKGKTELLVCFLLLPLFLLVGSEGGPGTHRTKT